MEEQTTAKRKPDPFLIFCAVFAVAVLLILSIQPVILPLFQKGPEPLPIPTENLQRAEFYSFAPEDEELRTRYDVPAGTDGYQVTESTKNPTVGDNSPALFLLTGLFNNIIYQNSNVTETDELPLGSKALYQANFYYNDGNQITAFFFPQAISINGTNYLFLCEPDYFLQLANRTFYHTYYQQHAYERFLAGELD